MRIIESPAYALPRSRVKMFVQDGFKQEDAEGMLQAAHDKVRKLHGVRRLAARTTFDIECKITRYSKRTVTSYIVTIDSVSRRFFSLKKLDAFMEAVAALEDDARS